MLETDSENAVATHLADMSAVTAAITDGDWYWGGNTDMGDVGLYSHIPGKGRVVVLGLLPHHFTRAEAVAKVGGSDLDPSDRADLIRRICDTPENRLAFGNADARFIVEARDTVIYEVARNQGLPDDTPRSHPEVYRADVVGSRHPNAAFMAAAPKHLRAASAALTEIHKAVTTVLAADPDDSAARAVAAILNRHLGDTEKSAR